MTQYIALLSAVTEDTRPLGEKLSEAGINTVIAISIVFLALAFISVIIAIEGKIFVSINKKAASKKVVEAPAPAAVPETVEESTDDEELVAVITAAIYEYEMQTNGAVPAGGLFVRSIRRRL